jgi:uncharacterized protein
MTTTDPHPARGSGRHPVIMITIAASDLAASTEFYRRVFHWPFAAISPELASAAPPGGPMVTLRANDATSAQGVVPFIAVDNLAGAIDTVIAEGGSLERAPGNAPMVGMLARVTDPSGTVYGLATAPPGFAPAHTPAPFGDAPKPLADTVCSLEMHAAPLDTAAHFFRAIFGWETQPTMPQYLMFDAGAGIGGVFQSHTPASRGVAYIYAPDVRATLAQITAAGGQPMGEAMTMPGMATFGYFGDPSGTMMGLIGP